MNVLAFPHIYNLSHSQISKYSSLIVVLISIEVYLYMQQKFTQMKVNKLSSYLVLE